MEDQLRNEEIEIDLMELFLMLLRKWKLLAAGLLAGIIIAAAVTAALITPQYESSSMIYILTKTTSVTSLADLQMGTQLTVDFETLATSRPVIDDVQKKLGLKDISYEEFTHLVKVSNPTDTRILKITATHPDPETAAKIANAMADATADRVSEVMSTDRPSIVEEGVVPVNPASPNMIKNAAIGGILGFLLLAGIVVVRFLMDDTIKTEEDVTRHLQLNTLAAVPLEKGEEPAKKRKRKKHAA